MEAIISKRFDAVAEKLKEHSDYDPDREGIKELSIEIDYFQGEKGISPIIKGKIVKYQILS